MGAVLTVTDLENDPLPNLNFNVYDVDNNLWPYQTTTPIFLNFPEGWWMFGIPKKCSTLHNYMNGTVAAGDTSLTMEEFLKKNLLDTSGNPINPGDIHNYVEIVKNNNGLAYLPQFQFDGIGELTDFSGYQIKLNQACKIKLYGENHVIESGVNAGRVGAIIPFAWDLPYTAPDGSSGWAMVSFPITQSIPLASLFQGQTNQIIIFKDYIGNAYIPEWNYDGIGVVQPGYGYIMKVSTDYAGGDTWNLDVIQNYHSGSYVDFNIYQADLGSGGPINPPTDLTDTSAELVIKENTIETLFSDSTFSPEHYEILNIKEKFLEEILGESLENNFPSSERKVYREQLDNFLAPKTGTSGTTLTEVLSYTKGEDDGKKNTSGTLQNNFFYCNKYPYFEFRYQNLLNSLFATTWDNYGLETTDKVIYYKNLINACNFRFYVTDNSGNVFASAKTGQVYLRPGGRFKDAHVVMIGDDALAAGAQGFTSLQAYNILLGIQSKSQAYTSKIIRVSLAATFNTSESTIGDVSNLGKYETDSIQAVETLTATSYA